MFFFKKIVNKEKLTTAESYSDALHDCQDLLHKSEEGIKKADFVFYESVKGQLASTQQKVSVLLKQGDAIKKETIEEVQQDIVGLRQSVIERVGSFIFKNLILDALTLANRKLSHIKATLLKSHPVAGKKKRKDNHKDSNFEKN